MPEIKAILYDLDGVLVDACEWHYAALNVALEEICGKDATISRQEHKFALNGLPTRTKLDYLVSRGRVRGDQYEAIWKRKQIITMDMIGQHARPDPAMIVLHNFTAHRGVRSACVTNSIRETATLMLAQTDQLTHMSVLVTNEDVAHPKPSSEGFIVAMVTLAVSPREVLIIEDSDKGIKAAEATGANVLRVKNSSEVPAKVRAFLD